MAKHILKLVIICACFILLIPVIEWLLIKATWVGSAKTDCDQGGACWAVITARWDQIIYGFYPKEEKWRVNFAFLILMTSIVFCLLFKSKLRYRLFIFSFINICVVYILYGGYFLTKVTTDLWGGLFLTVLFAIEGMICSFPLAILLALGRNSKLTIVKPLCVIFIEIIRGVPLVAILFFAVTMLPLFFSSNVIIDNLLCVFVALALFEAAYLAEVIRGGLNSIPKEQLEAATALGITYWSTIFYIVLPQGLRIAIPGILNSFISLFKDTTLLLIIGIYDFLGIVQTATTDPRWLGTALEAYLFCGLVYWFFCFNLSMGSKYLEKKLRMRTFK